jgi:hypothetical protein
MLCSLSTDLIAIEVKCSECLSKIASEWENEKKGGGVVSLCFVVEYSQDIVLADHRFDSFRG